MSIKKIYLAIALIAIIYSSFVEAKELAAFSLPRSEVLSIHAKANNKNYEVYIQLPKSYKSSTKMYPLIIVNDSRFAFSMTSGIMELMGTNNVAEAIIVGISYSRGDDESISRTRDYTPTSSPNEEIGYSAESRKASGHAKEYVEFLADQVIPLLEKNYRVDADNKIFVGHSFSGLLGCYILVNRPEVFDHYIIGSPSLWYDKKVIFSMEKAYAERHKNLTAHAMIYVDDNNSDPRKHEMADDVLAFEKVLRSRHYADLNLQVEVIKGENHHSVFPRLLSRGLMAAIPARK